MYNIKCDDCKKVIRKTEDIQKSYAGGLCKDCRKIQTMNITPHAALIIRKDGKEVAND